jgi:dephospho-CoA kinase
LRQIITDDDTARKTLESILHHEISTLISENVIRLEKEGHRMVVIEAPLLFELNLQERFDWVIMVSASQELRIQRLMKRDQISRDSAEKLIGVQMPDKKKIEGADYVVRNEGSKEDLARSVDVLFKNLSDTVKRQKALDRQ